MASQRVFQSCVLFVVFVTFALLSVVSGKNSTNDERPAIPEQENTTDTAVFNCSDEALAHTAQRCVPRELADLVIGREVDTDVTQVCRMTVETQQCLDDKTLSCDLSQAKMATKRKQLLPFVDPMISVCRGLGKSEQCTAKNLQNCLMLLPPTKTAATNAKEAALCRQLRLVDLCLSHFTCKDQASFKSAMLTAVGLWNNRTHVKPKDSFFYCKDSAPEKGLISKDSNDSQEVDFHCSSLRDPKIPCHLAMVGYNDTRSWAPCQGLCQLSTQTTGACEGEGQFYNFSTSACEGCKTPFVAVDGYICGQNSGAGSPLMTSLLLMTSLVLAVLCAGFDDVIW